MSFVIFKFFLGYFYPLSQEKILNLNKAIFRSSLKGVTLIFEKHKILEIWI